MDATPLDADLQMPCLKALAGRGFHGDMPAGWETVASLNEADTWCCNYRTVSAITTSECTYRLAVILGYVPGAAKGNPCLPAA